MNTSDVVLREPHELLNPQRFDIMAKYVYVEHKDKGYNSKYSYELYTKHIEAFSGGGSENQEMKIRIRWKGM